MLLPTGDVVIQDEFTTGVENYKEFFYTLVGLAGEGQNFDGNGMYVRFQTGGGAELAVARLGVGRHRRALRQRGRGPARQPALLSRRASRRTARPSTATRRRGPNLNGPAAAKSAPTGQAALAARKALPELRKRLRPFGSKDGARVTAIRKHWRDFVAIIVLLVIALIVGRVILANQRFSLPAGVPVLGKDYVEVEARAHDARRRSRRARGRPSTSPASRSARSRASSSRTAGRSSAMKIDREHATIYRDATILLRPKTGLKDMMAELTPGTPEAGELTEGERIPVSQTLPDVNLDEILASLDADTRDYLKLLLGDGGAGAARQRARAGADDPPLRADRPLRARGQRAARARGATTSGASSTTSRC